MKLISALLDNRSDISNMPSTTARHSATNNNQRFTLDFQYECSIPYAHMWMCALVGFIVKWYEIELKKTINMGDTVTYIYTDNTWHFEVLYDLLVVDISTLEHILERWFPCRQKPGTGGFSNGDRSDLQAVEIDGAREEVS